MFSIPEMHPVPWGHEWQYSRMVALRGAFVTWILHERHGGTVEVPAPRMIDRRVGDGRPAEVAGSATESWAIPELIHGLWDDTRAFPPSMTELLWLVPDTTFSDVVRLLHDTFDGGNHVSHGSVIDDMMVPGRG